MPFKEVLLARTRTALQRRMDAGAAPPGDVVTVALDLRAAVIGAVSLRINQPDLPWPPLAEQIDRFLTKLVGLYGADRPLTDTVRRSSRLAGPIGVEKAAKQTAGAQRGDPLALPRC